MRTRALVATGVAVLGLVVAGCGGSSSAGTAPAPAPNAPEVNAAGDIPDDQAFVAYAPPGGGLHGQGAGGLGPDELRGRRHHLHRQAQLRPGRVARRARPAPPVADGAQRELPRLAAPCQGFPPAGSARSAGRRAPPSSSPTRPTPRLTRSPGRHATDAVERYAFFHAGTEVVLTLQRARRAPTTSTPGGSSPTRCGGDVSRAARGRATSTASSTPATTRRSPCGASP